eukprot:1752528-Rhodomonas_salina.1
MRGTDGAYAATGLGRSVARFLTAPRRGGAHAVGLRADANGYRPKQIANAPMPLIWPPQGCGAGSSGPGYSAVEHDGIRPGRAPKRVSRQRVLTQETNAAVEFEVPFCRVAQYT